MNGDDELFARAPKFVSPPPVGGVSGALARARFAPPAPVAESLYSAASRGMLADAKVKLCTETLDATGGSDGSGGAGEGVDDDGSRLDDEDCQPLVFKVPIAPVATEHSGPLSGATATAVDDQPAMRAAAAKKKSTLAQNKEQKGAVVAAAEEDEEEEEKGEEEEEEETEEEARAVWDRDAKGARSLPLDGEPWVLVKV